LLVAVGHGVGLGIIVDGKIYRGASGAASVMLDELFRPPLYETDPPLPIDELLDVKKPAHR
jgi:hypothetical protein